MPAASPLNPTSTVLTPTQIYFGDDDNSLQEIDIVIENNQYHIKRVSDGYYLHYDSGMFERWFQPTAPSEGIADDYAAYLYDNAVLRTRTLSSGKVVISKYVNSMGSGAGTDSLYGTAQWSNLTARSAGTGGSAGDPYIACIE